MKTATITRDTKSVLDQLREALARAWAGLAKISTRRRSELNSPWRCPACLMSTSSYFIAGRLTEVNKTWSGKAQLKCMAPGCGKIWTWKGVPKS